MISTAFPNRTSATIGFTVSQVLIILGLALVMIGFNSMPSLDTLGLV